MIKLATPISHLFEDVDLAQQIINSSDCFECRDRSITSTIDKQELFHCELQPIHHWGQEEFDYLKRIKESKANLKLITFHIAACCDAPEIVDNMFIVGGTCYSKEQMLENAAKNISQIKAIFGNDIKIAVENNNYYPTEAYQFVTDPEFISEVVYSNDIYFLFDIAHAKVTSYNKNVNFEKYKNALPLDKVIQLHICTYAIDQEKDIAFDAHNIPDEEELLEVEKLLKEYKTIQYLTVEYYKDIENLIKSLQKVKELI